MPVFKHTIFVNDKPWNRAIQVIITSDKEPSQKKIEELGQRAWKSPTKTIKVGNVVVKARGFDR